MKGTANSALVILLVLFTGFCLVRCFAAQETVTITTYYPAPYGVYRDLNITRTLLINPANTVDAWNNGITFTGLSGIADGSGENVTMRLVNIGAMTTNVTINGVEYLTTDNNVAELRIQTGGSDLDRIYIGGFGTVTGNGHTVGGLRVNSLGSGYFSGIIKEHCNSDFKGCVRMTYGSDSGATQCPPGSRVTAITGDGFANSPQIAGGYFWCCNY